MIIDYSADLAPLTTFGIHAKAAAVARWQTVADLRAIIADTSLPRPLKPIGGGSNLLFTRDFPGTLLLRTGRPEVNADRGALWSVDAGITLDNLCAMTAMADLRGLENLSGIPGTLGGAIVQNAGAYGAEISQVLVSATLLDMTTGELLTVNREWMDYSYRSSRLKIEGDRYVILSALIRLQPGDFPANLAYGNLQSVIGSAEPTPAAVRAAVLSIRASKLPDPAVIGSAGSFFRNPEVPASALTTDMPRYDLGNGLFKVPAAWLIDHAGLKGSACGGASLWPSQPLVIVNTNGSATSADVLALEQHIIATVGARFSITLTPEVEHL